MRGVEASSLSTVSILSLISKLLRASTGRHCRSKLSGNQCLPRLKYTCSTVDSWQQEDIRKNEVNSDSRVVEEGLTRITADSDLKARQNWRSQLCIRVSSHLTRGRTCQKVDSWGAANVNIRVFGVAIRAQGDLTHRVSELEGRWDINDSRWTINLMLFQSG